MATPLSAAAQYAVRAMVQVARQGPSQAMRVRDVAEAEGVPFAFLAKQVQLLVRGGLLVSAKGRGGGIRLGRRSQRISVLDVVECIEGPGTFARCVLGLPRCGDRKPCALHARWAGVRDRLLEELRTTTIAELAAGSIRRSTRR